MERVYGDYKISTDKSLLSVKRISEMLDKSYWAAGRPWETIEASIRNSICYGIYKDNEQVGFARVVTDYATMYWVCDVIIDEEHRGRKLGALLIESIVNAEELKGIGKGILTTRDAQGLYEKFGFRSIESGMIRKLSDLEAEQLKEDRW